MISQALRSRIYLCKSVRSEGTAVHILHQCDIIALLTGKSCLGKSDTKKKTRIIVMWILHFSFS